MSKDASESEVGFTVDTHIFRELGELLVGRDSTALAELVKNAYDADATKVVISGLSLSDPSNAVIRIVDDGNGMTRKVFQEGFLRIAGRQKEAGDRRSLRFKRRFTGEKGIGRLAAHKLAKKMKLASIPHADLYPGSDGLEAIIDWGLIEQATTLEETRLGGGVTVSEREVSDHALHGTWIELTKLRRNWTPQQRQRLYAELNDFLIPEALLELDPKLYEGPRLVPHLPVRDEASQSVPFTLEMTDDFDVGESFWMAVLDQNAWLLEIDASSKSDRISFLLTPSRSTKVRFPDASQIKLPDQEVESNDDRPRFHARIVIREGAVRADGPKKNFAQSIYGVRMYVEGFRVAPYGEPGNDWLNLDADYTRRGRLAGDEAIPDLGLSSPYNRLVFGAVVMTQESSKPLRMLVNREGFVADAAMDFVRDTVQLGINHYVRRSAALKHVEKQRVKTGGGRPFDSTGFTVATEAAQALRSTAESARETAEHATRLAKGGNAEEATKAVQDAAESLLRGASQASELLSEVEQTRILASIGLQMGAFVHEVRAVQLYATSLRDDFKELMTKVSSELGEAGRRSTGELTRRLSDLTQMLERQASFLSDAISVDSRRRRSHQFLRKRLESAMQLVAPQIARRNIIVEILIPENLKTPPMFSAELTLILSNLLTNAVKAAGPRGTIVCEAYDSERELVFRMENTGVAVDLAEAERWFRPFESTSNRPDPSLGIGMGLGLPITRDMINQYGGIAHFVSPRAGFSTAVELRLPKRRL